MTTTTTTNLGLVKPGGDEYPKNSREDFNDNFDTIDAAVGAVDVETDGSLQEQVTALGESVSRISTVSFTTSTSSVNANSVSSPIDIDVSQQGKTPIGVVAYNTGSRYLYSQYFMFITPTVLRIYLFNVSNNAITATLHVVVLYI